MSPSDSLDDSYNLTACRILYYRHHKCNRLLFHGFSQCDKSSAKIINLPCILSPSASTTSVAIENEVEIVDEMIAKEENEDEAKNVLEVLGMDEIKHEVEIIAKVESDEVFEIELDDDVVEEEMKGRDKIVYELEWNGTRSNINMIINKFPVKTVAESRQCSNI